MFYFFKVFRINQSCVNYSLISLLQKNEALILYMFEYYSIIIDRIAFERVEQDKLAGNGLLCDIPARYFLCCTFR